MIQSYVKLIKKPNKNCVDVSLILGYQQSKNENLSCCICLQIMTHPYVANCQGAGVKHVFGINCINQWTHKSGKKCPLCRHVFTHLQPANQLSEFASKLMATCKQCEIQLPAKDINSHLSTCEKRMAKLKQKLNEVITNQLFWLQKQINPHVRLAHAQIYEKYVQQWKWLHYDSRNWKWWWWCNNPWWQNKSCPSCNELWHKYQVQIDLQQDKRVALLKELSFEEQQKNEKVQCKND